MRSPSRRPGPRMPACSAGPARSAMPGLRPPAPRPPAGAAGLAGGRTCPHTEPPGSGRGRSCSGRLAGIDSSRIPAASASSRADRNSLLVELDELRHKLDVEVPAGHRGDAEELDRPRIECLHATGEHPLDPLGQLEALEIRRGGRPHAESLPDQVADDLLDEERVAFGLPVDLPGKGAGGRSPALRRTSSAVSRLGQPGDVELGGQALAPDLGQARRTGRRWPPRPGRRSAPSVARAAAPGPGGAAAGAWAGRPNAGHRARAGSGRAGTPS